MANKGLKVSPEELGKARTALIDKNWSHAQLAAMLGITRQPIYKFFAGEPVSRRCFVQICKKLDISWQKVAGLPEEPKEPPPEKATKDEPKDFEVDALVQEFRHKCLDKIQDQCGTMRMLDIARPIALAEIYISVTFLEEITSQQWLEISQLRQDFYAESDEFGRFRLGRVRQQRVGGINAVSRYPKLMVLGKLGSGKTMFLQHLAIQCSQGNVQADRVPIFITLKNFAKYANEHGDFRLFNYISQVFRCCGLLNQEVTQTLLNQGKWLILLDGLDEVPSEHKSEVVEQIRQFSEQYHKNHLIITCRLAASEYRFPGFTDVEIADFNDEQIRSFAEKWFVAVARNSQEEGQALANQFINQLNLPENQQIQELAITPILLHLTCLKFQAQATFPTNRANLYEQVLNSLLVRWDEARGIQRDEIYRKLTRSRKIELLSQIAVITFEAGDYLFEQSKIQQLITDYLGNLQDTKTNLDQLHLDSEAVLKCIEAQHGLLVERSRGIYSFSHLTFQEYFTAREIVTNSIPQTLEKLVSNLADQNWHGVFLLTASMLPNADRLLRLMKQKIDSLVASDEKLQRFLTWLDEKSASVFISRKTVAVRAFYLVCDRAFSRTQSYELENTLTLVNLADTVGLEEDLALDQNLACTLVCARDVGLAVDDTTDMDIILTHAHAMVMALDEALNYALKPELERSLQQLKAQLPNLTEKEEEFKQWWQLHGQTWTEELSTLMIEHCNLGHDWQFNQQQKALLQQYHDGNLLLVKSLYRASSVTPAVLQEIEETLLLPIVKVKR